MQYIDKLAWIEIQNKTILTSRSFGKDKFYIPGGKREMGESDEQALIREIKEELNVDIDLSTIEYVGTYEAQAHGHPAGVMVRMTCYAAAYTGELSASAEIEEIKWLTTADQAIISFVDKIIFQDLYEKNLLD